MADTSAALKAKVRLILSQVPAITTPFYALRTPMAKEARDKSVNKFDAPHIDGPGDVELIQEQVKALRTLYAQSSPARQKEFVPLLLSLSSATNAAVAVHAIVEVGGLVALVSVFKKTRASDVGKRFAMWKALREKLAHEAHRFTEADLDLIEEARIAESTRVNQDLELERKIRMRL